MPVSLPWGLMRLCGSRGRGVPAQQQRGRPRWHACGLWLCFAAQTGFSARPPQREPRPPARWRCGCRPSPASSRRGTRTSSPTTPISTPSSTPLTRTPSSSRQTGRGSSPRCARARRRQDIGGASRSSQTRNAAAQDHAWRDYLREQNVTTNDQDPKELFKSHAPQLKQVRQRQGAVGRSEA